MNMPRAYTLIELLIVLAIIASLAAILFPVFASSKRSAKVEVGKQYLHQQFITFEMYATNENGVYPGYLDVVLNADLQAPCSPLYDWKQPRWVSKQDITVNQTGLAPMVGGRGYLYALPNWKELETEENNGQ